MQIPPLHPREADRLAALRSCGVLDTAPEPDFDALTALASAIAGVPIALISLVDEHRQWFKSHHGLDASETPRELAFCAHAILDSEQPLVVRDALADPRFHDNPLVTGAPRVVFYAGVPLRVGEDRLPVGTLCVIDHQPHDLPPERVAQLELLARQTELLLDLRRRQHALETRLMEVHHAEQDLQSILGTMAEGLVVQDHQGVITTCNAAAERILGLTEHQMRGLTSLDPRWRSIHADGSPFPGDQHPAMVTLATGEPQRDVVMGVGLEGGETRWILINAQPLTTGVHRRVATTFTDITHLRREEEERLRAERRMERFLSLSHDLWSIANPLGTFTRVNPAWTTVTGWSADELTSRPFLEFVHPDDVAATLLEAAALNQGGQTIHFINRYRCKSGGWKMIEWNAVGLPDEGVSMAVARDVTADREREATLREAKDAAEAADRAKSSFLATMSHEIRTPMNGVLGMAEALGRTSLDADQRDLLDTLIVSGTSLLTVINDILDWSKIQAGRMDLHLQSVDVVHVVGQVLDLLRPTAEAKGLLLTLDGPRVPLWAHVDPIRVRQVVTNLVGNAVKFTDAGQATVRVRPLGEDRCQIAVIDTGIGIAEDHLPRLFTRFTQVDDSFTRRHGGTGLGLAISQQLVQAMGGSLDVESRLGQGSAFTVTLPSAVAPAPPAPRPPAPVAGQRPLHVLVAEDQPINRKVITLMLTRLGHRVTFTEDGAATAAADLTGIDVVLMDLQMPVMDGLEATRRIRARESAAGQRRVPILALTAAAMATDHEACTNAGMDGVITKPVTLEALTAALAQV